MNYSCDCGYFYFGNDHLYFAVDNIRKYDEIFAKGMIYMIKRLGTWGNSLSIRLDCECAELGWKQGDKVHVLVQDGKMIMERVISEYQVINGVKYEVKEG